MSKAKAKGKAEVVALSTVQPTAPTGRLIALTDWPAHHPWPTVSGLRMMVFHAGETGADRWIKRVGRRILISEGAFFAWVDAQNPEPSPSGAESAR